MTQRRFLAAAVFVVMVLGVAAQQAAPGSSATAAERHSPEPRAGASAHSLTLQTPSPAGNGLDLVILSRITTAPSYVRSVVRPAAHPGNHLLRVTVESTGFARTTEVALTGEAAPASCFFYWRDLSPGLYDMVAVVLGASGEVLSQRRLSFAVVGGASAG